MTPLEPRWEGLASHSVAEVQPSSAGLKIAGAGIERRSIEPSAIAISAPTPWCWRVTLPERNARLAGVEEVGPRKPVEA